jgi:hypothetical protein
MGLLDGILGVGGAVGSALIGSNAATQAQKAQERAVGKAQGALTSAYNQGIGYQKPAYDIGQQNLQTLNQMVNQGAYNASPYSYQIGQAPQDQFNFRTDPGYQFRMQQGQNGLNSASAAAGNQLSGASQKALQRYGQNFASNEYNNAFNKFSNQRDFNQGQYQYGTTAGMGNAQNIYNSANQQAQQQYNRMAGLADLGVSGGQNMANYAQNYGNQMAGQYGNLGNAQAAGIIGRGQAWQTGLNNAMGGLSGQMNGSGYGSFGGSGSAQGAFNNTPYGQAFNQSQGLLGGLQSLGTMIGL